MNTNYYIFVLRVISTPALVSETWETSLCVEARESWREPSLLFDGPMVALETIEEDEDIDVWYDAVGSFPSKNDAEHHNLSCKLTCCWWNQRLIFTSLGFLTFSRFIRMSWGSWVFGVIWGFWNFWMIWNIRMIWLLRIFRCSGGSGSDGVFRSDWILWSNWPVRFQRRSRIWPMGHMGLCAKWM